MDSATSSNISTRLPVDLATPQDVLWGQESASYSPSNIVGTSNLNSNEMETQYPAPAVNFDTGESFGYDMKPDTISALLESELAAVTICPTGSISRAELADMSRELYPPSGD